MKTNIYSKVAVSITFTALVMASCTKEKLNPVVSTGTTTEQMAVNLAGTIVDRGLKDPNSELRVMAVNINTGKYTVNDIDYSSSSSALAQINAYFYVGEDGRIPDGTYNFSPSVDKQQFTFDSGSFLNPNNSSKGTNETPQFETILGGTINVTMDTYEVYTFAFNLELESGSRIFGVYSGLMNYSDN
jgi:hypothetical protein